MRTMFLLILVLLTACNSKPEIETAEQMDKVPNNEITTYYFIRHAEKDTSDLDEKDPELIELGVLRAENWAKVFKDINFDLIYSSAYKRTLETAKSTALSQQREIEIYDTSNLNDENFQRSTKGKTVLIVGHSNTNPKFVNYILEEERYDDIPDEESGSLFIVSIFPDGSKYSQLLYIN